MQNPIQKFRQISIVFEKPGFLSEKLKILPSSNYHRLNIFHWNFSHILYLPMSTKGWSGFFLFCLDLEFFAKIKKDLVSTHSFFTFLLITQDLNKIKKSQTPFCRHCQVGNTCKISAKNIELCGSWSLSKFSIFQTNNLVSQK